VELSGTRSVEGGHDFVARTLLERGLGETRDEFGVHLRLGIPVIGIGAPASFFLPEAALRLNAEAAIPADGDVANAIGAITSGIRVTLSAEIHPDERGDFHVTGVAGAPVFGELAAAQAYAESMLRERAEALARQSGAIAPDVLLSVRDRIATLADGADLFVGRTIVAVASGLPGR
jgi:hypothetical protein